MDSEDVVKRGNLSIPSHNFLRLKQKKIWIKKYFILYRRSLSGIQRLEMFDNQESFADGTSKVSKLIPLNECHKVKQAYRKHQSNVFEVRLRDKAQMFSAETFQDMMDWLICIQSIAFDNNTNKSNANSLSKNNNIVQANDQFQYFNNQLTSVNFHLTSEVEENLLYSSLESSNSFKVKIFQSEATKRCGLFDNLYLLILSGSFIALAEETILKGCERKVLWTWPYRHIRRYGCTKDSFSLEAGRKCPSGEGIFAFITKEGSKIFKNVANQVNWLKSSHFKCPLQPSFFFSDEMNNIKLSQHHFKCEYSNEKDQKLIKIAKPNCPVPDLTENNFNANFINGHKSLSSETKLNDLNIFEPTIKVNESSNRVVLMVNGSALTTKDNFNDHSANDNPILPSKSFNSQVFPQSEVVSTKNGSCMPDPLYEDLIFAPHEKLFNQKNNRNERNCFLLNESNNRVSINNTGQENLVKNAPILRFASVLRSIFGVSLTSIVSQKKKKTARKANSNSSHDSSENSLFNQTDVNTSSTFKLFNSSSLTSFKISPQAKNEFNEDKSNSQLCQVNNCDLDNDNGRYANICNGVSNEKLETKRVQNISPQHYIKNEAEYALIMKTDLDCVDL